MKYISEKFVPADWIEQAEENNATINVRLCRDCKYFEREHPTIETDSDFGYCVYRTDFAVFDDELTHWYFTDINGFCREDNIND